MSKNRHFNTLDPLFRRVHSHHRECRVLESAFFDVLQLRMKMVRSTLPKNFLRGCPKGPFGPLATYSCTKSRKLLVLFRKSLSSKTKQNYFSLRSKLNFDIFFRFFEIPEGFLLRACGLALFKFSYKKSETPEAIQQRSAWMHRMHAVHACSACGASHACSSCVQCMNLTRGV